MFRTLSQVARDATVGIAGDLQLFLDTELSDLLGLKEGVGLTPVLILGIWW